MSERLSGDFDDLLVLQQGVFARWQVSAMALDIAEGVLSPLENRYVRDVEQPHGLPAAKRQVVIARGGRRQAPRTAIRLSGRGGREVGQRG